MTTKGEIKRIMVQFRLLQQYYAKEKNVMWHQSMVHSIVAYYSKQDFLRLQYRKILCSIQTEQTV